MSDIAQAPEVVPVPDASMVLDTETGSTVLATPTQVRRPWRSTMRTIFQGGVALASLAPLVAAGWYDGADADTYPAAVAQVLVVSGGVTRIMAIPAVEVFLRKFLPFLAAAPRPAADPA